MKFIKLVLILLLIISGVILTESFASLKLKNINQITQSLKVEPNNSETKTQKPQLIKNYAYYDYELNFEKEELLFHSNLEELAFSKQKIQNLNCKFMTNAGFYTEKKSHIGLFKQNNKIISQQIRHNLFDSFVGFNNSSKEFYIGKKAQVEKYENIFQTGPMLFNNGKIQKLKLKNDNNARRIVVAQTNENKIYFVTFFDSKLKTSGPLLNDLPTLLQEYAKLKGIKILNATNLDGGNHSFFMSGNQNLPELSKAGGFVCAKAR
ncbi:MAG: phosphodiester glycosidase family protein [Patescibacteria group bacterium]|nr:phosphodiester glycosidase family protein [Patescibacteria group bacterium]